MRYHGAKHVLAPWVIGHFPWHRCYVEPFGGSAAVLMAKDRSHAEVYNDIDDEVVNVFRILRDPYLAGKLTQLLELTPFSRTEFKASYEETGDPIEQARRTLLRAMAGFGSASVCKAHKTGFRSNSTRSGTTPAHDWRNYPARIPEFVDRLRGVVIENKDAIEVMQQHDGGSTLHYVDPPYAWSTRRAGSGTWSDSYRHEMTDPQHLELLRSLKKLTGMVVLSGYRCEMYDESLGDWTRFDRAAHADGARDRVESLWLNPVAMAARQPALMVVSSD